MKKEDLKDQAIAVAAGSAAGAFMSCAAGLGGSVIFGLTSKFFDSRGGPRNSDRVLSYFL
jgi:hypothetical protein